MTISSTANKAVLYGNGVATSWPFKFRIPALSQMSVILTDPLGNQTTLTPSQFTVTGVGSANGGTVTYPLSGSPLAALWSLTILRTLPLVQQTDIVNQDGFFPDVVEAAFDYLTMVDQQLSEAQARSLCFPVVDDLAVVQPVLPAAAQRANKGMGFDSSGNPFVIDLTIGSVLAPVVHSIAMLRLASKLVTTDAFVSGYYAAGDGGGGAYYLDTADTTSTDNGGTVIVAADGGRWKLRRTGWVSVKQFGAKGDNATDDWPAFNAAIIFCQSGQTKLDIPEGSYLLSKQLMFSNSFDVRCDDTAALRWNSAASCGILFDFQDSNDTLATINLPQLFSPAINSSFAIPGYGPTTYTYDLSTRTGNALWLRGGNRLNINVLYAAGWSSAVQLESTPTAVLANVNVNVNTIDFCIKGFTTYASGANSLGVVAVVCKANTVWAKYPIYLDGTNQFLVASRFKITGQAFVNEVDGAGIYGLNVLNKVDTCNFDINWLSAGYASDSTTGTPTTLVCPFVAGSASSNGATTDGNATIGYWAGNFCTFRIGPVMGIPGGKSASAVPAAGDTIRIRDVGAYNAFEMLNSQSVFVSPISTTTTVGEANYNGGVGGAQYAKRVLCQATLPSLAPLANSAFHYVYHQCISRTMNKQVRVTPIDSSFAADAIEAFAACDAGTNNRQIRLVFTNTSATRSTTAKTVFFALEID